MSLGDDLLTTARSLARARPKKPRQADLRRAVSTSYYAAFHALARECADRLVGTSSTHSATAWRQVYRGLEHGPAKQACARAANLEFPDGIVGFAGIFLELQEERHRADYDPTARYTRKEANEIVGRAAQAIRDLRSAPRNDRTAFAALALIRRGREARVETIGGGQHRCYLDDPARWHRVLTAFMAEKVA
mgnify:CR=1 FL=1